MKKNGKGAKGSDRLLLAVGIVFLLIFVISGAGLLRYYGEYREQKESYDGLAALRGGTSGEDAADGETAQVSLSGNNTGDGAAARESYERLRALNDDYIGWITVPDTQINYPFLQRDNSYYLNHDFYGEKSSHGAIFLDEDSSPQDCVILIHGHHMKDKTMFGALKAFEKREFAKEHPTLYLDWGSGDEPYRIFAAALIDLTDEDYFHYNELPDTGEETEQYLKKLKQNAVWYDDPGKDGETGQIVLLSTCEYGTKQQRLVVAAVSESFEGQ